MTDATPRFKDFTFNEAAPTMRVAPDDFRCYPEIPLDVMMDVVEMAQQDNVSGMQRFKQMLELFAGVIVAEDYDRFIARTKRGTPEAPNPNPIGIRHVKDMLPWIMEVYGLRPTQESSESSDGSEPDDTSLTEHSSDTE